MLQNVKHCLLRILIPVHPRRPWRATKSRHSGVSNRSLAGTAGRRNIFSKWSKTIEINLADGRLLASCHATIKANTLHHAASSAGNARHRINSSRPNFQSLFIARSESVPQFSDSTGGQTTGGMATGDETRGGPPPETSLQSAPIPGHHYHSRTDCVDKLPLSNRPCVHPERSPTGGLCFMAS